MTATRQLLAAYAAGGLTDDERQRVDALLAEDAGARAELDALRALLDDVRGARPTPSTEPAWDDMARSIRLAVADAPPARWWSRWWVRPLALSGAAAAAAVALYLAFGSSTRTDAPAPRAAETVTDDVVVVALPGLAEAWDADSIVYELAPDEEFEDMFADAYADEDTESELDFRLAPTVDELLDGLDDDELDAIDAYLEGIPS